MYLRNICFSVLLLSLPFSSCQKDECYSKNQFVNSYTAFFDEFEKQSEDLSEKHLKMFEERYEKLLENCYKKYKSELSIDERKEFWKSSISFYIDKEGGIFNIQFNEADKEDPIKTYIISEIEEMTDSTTQEFSEFLESVLEDELPKLIDSIVDKVEEIGDELKRSLENKDD